MSGFLLTNQLKYYIITVMIFVYEGELYVTAFVLVRIVDRRSLRDV